MKKVVCFGEVLWDMLPSGKKLGGAPLNVALRMQSFGCSAQVISSVGGDASGDEIMAHMKAHHASLEHLQVSDHYATSEVLVNLDEKGAATYEIKMPCAWDDIKLLEDDVKTVQAADAFLYGSLISRQQTSRDTLFALLQVSQFNVFDVNLRPPHYDTERLLKLMKYAHFIKLNDDEIFEMCAAIGAKDLNLEESVSYLAAKTQTSNICVTLGAEGALLYQDGEFVYNKGYKIKVADTVGAGDSFLATLISQLLAGASAQEAINYASAVGAIVASKAGANPKVTEQEIQAIMQIS